MSRLETRESLRPRTLSRLAVVVIALAGTAAGGALEATASAPPWTQITTPAHDTSVTESSSGVNVTVAGRTSSDVTDVDIACIYGTPNGRQSFDLATNVTVTNGRFTATGTTSSAPFPCRLRAVPNGVDVDTDYLGSFAGPILRFQYLNIETDGVPYNWLATASEGEGVAIFGSAGGCQESGTFTVSLPAVETGPVLISCPPSLPGDDQSAASPPKRSSLVIDGHNAYLPDAVYTVLRGSRGLAVTQTRDTVHRSVARNGDTTIAESAPVVRCSVADTYPATATSCPHVIGTGVTFRRTLTQFRSGHQLRIRDTFTSTDRRAHSVVLHYQTIALNETSGAPVGFLFPRHGTTFAAAVPKKVLTGFGPGSATAYIRSDVHASADDPVADTVAQTWSRPPSAVQFADGSPFLSYTFGLAVPAGGTGSLGFAVSERLRTADVKVLAAAAQADMRPGLRITAPATGATFSSTTTTVRGTVSAGANGLPVSVVVNGHRATVTRTSATSATFVATFDERAGVHTLSVVAADAFGNATARTVRVRNR